MAVCLICKPESLLTLAHSFLTAVLPSEANRWTNVWYYGYGNNLEWHDENARHWKYPEGMKQFPAVACWCPWRVMLLL